jgi:hypothetical protein
MQFGTNTPFIFHTANLPEPSTSGFKPYNPAEWTSESFGFGGTPARPAVGGVEDVEMRWDSPARDHTATATAGTEQGTATNVVTPGEEGRKIASGAVSRVRKKRQKEWRRRRHESETEGEGEGEDDGEVSAHLRLC